MPMGIGLTDPNELERWKRINAPEVGPLQYVPRFQKYRNVRTRDRWGDYQRYADKIMGMYQDAFNLPGVNYNVGNAGLGQMGTETFTVDPKYRQYVDDRLYNPKASTEMGMLRDQFAGDERAQNQSIADMMATRGVRGGGGALNSMMLNAQNDRNKAQSMAQRGLLTDIIANANQNKQWLEGTDIGARYQGQSDALGAFENSKQRELANAGLGLEAANAQRNWMMNLIGGQAGLLGDIGGFLSGARAQDFAEGQYNNEVIGMNDANANATGAAKFANQQSKSQWQNAMNKFNWLYPSMGTIGGRTGGGFGGGGGGGGIGPMGGGRGFGGGTGSWASRFGRGWGR